MFYCLGKIIDIVVLFQLIKKLQSLGLINLIALFETASFLLPYGYCEEQTGKPNKSGGIQPFQSRIDGCRF